MSNGFQPVGDGPNVIYKLTARTPSPSSELTQDHQTDVVVVGGGFTGLSAALHLAQSGHGVVLVEANTVGWGASGRNGGQVNAGLKYEPSVLEEKFGTDLGGRMAEFSGNAPERVFSLINKHSIDCEADRSGTVRAAFTRGSADFIERATADLQARGIPVTLLDRHDMRATTGTDRYLNGALDRRGGSLNPLGYARGLAAAAVDAGALIYENTRAIELKRSGEDWILNTPKAKVTASWVVLATNGYTDDLWPGLRQTVVPVFGGVIASEPLAAEDANRVMPGRHVLYEHESLTIYYRLDKANHFLIGGRSRLRPLDGPRHFGELVGYTKRLWPFMDKVRWTHGWNGQLAITTDSLPHFNEPTPNLIACLGYNGRGIAMGTAMGGEIARRVAGARPDELDMPVTTMKPIPFHRFWPIGASARIAYGRLRTRFAI